MAVDGIILNKLLYEIKEFLPCKINKIYGISDNELLFHLRNNKEKKMLMVSTHPIYNRINFTDRNYPTPISPINFVMLLRKHIEGAKIIDVIQNNYDRYCYFVLNKRNTLGDLITVRLYIELMGKYANVILVDENNKIIDALKRIPPFENQRRTIHPGAIFNEVEPQEKLNIENIVDIDLSSSLTSQIAGFSPLLEKEIRYRLSNNEYIFNILDNIKNSNKIYISNYNNEIVYHIIPLTMLDYFKEYDMHEGIDIIYYHLEEKDRIKKLTTDVYKVVKKELKHNKAKLPKLENSLSESYNKEIYKKYGELLYTYNINDTKGKNSIELFDYETNQYISIPIDSKFDGKSNARKMFQKYDKLKKAESHLLEQIAITQNEIDYFEGISEQLEISDFETAEEIVKELKELGYLRNTYNRSNRKKKNEIKIHTINYSDDIKIYYGKNNIQNEYITFKLSRKNYYWFHTKDYHGSHVMVTTDKLDEKLIRLCAMIAAYFSKGRYSSSIPINYTQIKDIKKIPGSKIGKVILSNYKTIYIDIDEEILSKYIDLK